MPFPWINVFLTGTHKTSSPKKTWTEDDVKFVVAETRSKGADMIPFVGGHPENNLPIFGYFSRNDCRVSTYNGVPSIQVRPAQFAKGGFEALSNSKFDKMSISVDKGIIEHIGFVEKQAVENLPPLGTYQFSASDDSETLDAQFAWQTSFEWNVSERFSAIASILQRIREDMIATDGNSERADKILSTEQLDLFTKDMQALGSDLEWMIRDEVSKQLATNKQPSLFQEDPMDPNSKDKKPDEAPDASKVTAQFEERMAALEKENKQLRADNLTARFSSVLDKCITEKKVMPAERDMHISAMQQLAQIDKSQFSADESKHPLEEYIKSLEARKPMTGMFGQVAGDGVPAAPAMDDDDKAINEFNKSRGN